VYRVKKEGAFGGYKVRTIVVWHTQLVVQGLHGLQCFMRCTASRPKQGSAERCARFDTLSVLFS
jgi:hypothetical protein